MMTFYALLVKMTPQPTPIMTYLQRSSMLHCSEGGKVTEHALQVLEKRA